MALLYLWDIIVESEEPPRDDANVKVKNEYKCCERKAFGMITINLDDASFSHVIAYNRPTKV